VRRKYVFRSRAEAEQALGRSRDQELLTNIALGEVLAGDVTWLERGSYRIGLVRPTSPDGGLAIVVWHHDGQRDKVEVWRVDEMVRELGPSSRALRWSSDPETHDLAHLVALTVVERDKRANAAPCLALA
jgi:hypothetical protein